MKFDRTKNATRNIAFGLLQRVYQLIIPFVLRTAMIYWLGVEYTGLDGLFLSVLSVLNLAELGVGSAMVYSMYKPVAEDDRARIYALMKLYKLYYRIIGMIVLIGGLIICPFVPKLIAGSVPEGINIYVLFLLNLAATVLSYWLFAYKNCLLQAYQRADVVSKVTMGVNTIRYLLQFVLLFVFHNYYIYLIVTLASQAGINIVTALIVNRMFPGYEAKGTLDSSIRKEINHRIRDLFTAKLGAVVVNQVDTLVISAFLGLTILAIYQNYFYIVTAVLGIINIFIYSCTSGIGNSIIVESKEKNFGDLRTFTFLIACLAAFCTACLLCLFQPFMEIWTGKDLMFTFPAVICFGIYFFIVQINTLLNTYKDAAGIWHEDRFRPLVTAIVNLSMNLLSVKYLGIYGILASTVLSMLLVGMPWLVHNLFTTIFEKHYLKQFILLLFEYCFAACAVCVISVVLGNLIPCYGIILMFLRLIICTVVSILVMIGLFHRTSEYKSAVLLADRITKGKLRLRKLLF